MPGKLYILKEIKDDENYIVILRILNPPRKSK